MSPNAVIDIARQAGAPDWWIGIGGGPATGWLVEFACLLLAHERQSQTAVERRACVDIARNASAKDHDLVGDEAIGYDRAAMHIMDKMGERGPLA